MANNFYSDDVTAAAMADDNQDPDNWKEKGEEPVTTGDIEIGDLDAISKDDTLEEDGEGSPSEDESQYESPD